MKDINTILFDFDGTVMDTNKVIEMSWQHTFRTLTGKEGDPDYIHSTFGEPLVYSMEKTFPDVPAEESVAIYRNFHSDKFLDTIELFPGIPELLAELKKEGYKVGLATSRMKRTTMMAVDKFGLQKYFDAIVTIDDVSNHKPHPESALKTLEKLGSKPEEAIMIGDTKFDIQCSRNAGVKSVLVGWSLALAGKGLADFPEGQAPDYIVQSPGEILEIIK